MALLFAADRYDHLGDLEGTVCERYVYSSLAYQSAQGLDPEWICELNKDVSSPGLVLLIDVEPSTALERIREARAETEIFENERLLEEVRNEYLSLFDLEPPYDELQDRYGFLDTEFKVVDGEQPVQEVADELENRVSDFLA